MRRGLTRLAPEVAGWLLTLSDNEFGQVACGIDLLREGWSGLATTHIRQLDGPLHELRVHLGARSVRLSYCEAKMGRIVLLTVIAGDQTPEGAEIRRASTAMEHWVGEDVLVEDREEERRHATA